MFRAGMLITIVLATGCQGAAPKVDYLQATAAPTAMLKAAAAELDAYCPSLAPSARRFRVLPAAETVTETGRRELDEARIARFAVDITEDDATEPGVDTGERCSFDVAPGKGLIASKQACVRLCDANGAPPDPAYLVKRR